MTNYQRKITTRTITYMGVIAVASWNRVSGEILVCAEYQFRTLARMQGGESTFYSL